MKLQIKYGISNRPCFSRLTVNKQAPPLDMRTRNTIKRQRSIPGIITILARNITTLISNLIKEYEYKLNRIK